MDPRSVQLFEKLSAALRKGYATEGVFVGADVFGRTCEFLSALPTTIPLPDLVVEGENQIGLDWDCGARRVLAVTVDDTPYLGFAALIGHEPVYGKTPFAGEFPQTLAYLVSRLYDS
jgi:hypothetical protein